jgi:hypothetical protein
MKKPCSPKAVALFCIATIIALMVGLYFLPRLLDPDLAAFRRIMSGMTEAEVEQVVGWKADSHFFLHVVFKHKVDEEWGQIELDWATPHFKTWHNDTCIIIVCFDYLNGCKVIGASFIRRGGWSLAEWLKSLWFDRGGPMK